MILDANGFPKDQNATDFQDSARLAGLMGLFCHPLTPDLTKYVIGGKYFRHPTERKYPFSRDQWVCLAAGLRTQGYRNLVDIAYTPENKDWMSPSQQDHIMRCRGMSDSWLGRLWFNLDIGWNGHIDPTAEPNQLISMVVIAGPEFVQKWKRTNKAWKHSILFYWSGWRGEFEFASFMIKRLEEY